MAYLQHEVEMVKQKGFDELVLKHLLDQILDVQNKQLDELKAIHALLAKQNKEWITERDLDD